MKSLWNDADAARYEGDLPLRVYTSRLLGRDPSLVLHGGGNTSVKLLEQDLFGREETILYVKGSGWDLETIEEAGFSPVRHEHLVALGNLKTLSDPKMVNELRTHMTRADAPTPSIEAILHALLPYKFVDHTHADAIVSVTNAVGGRERITEIYGDDVVVLPYIMPGFDLARACAEIFSRDAGAETLGVVLMNHGIFSFGASARESYERMIALVTRAEDYLDRHHAWTVSLPARQPSAEQPSEGGLRSKMAELRRDLSKAAGFPMLLCTSENSRALAFARHPRVAELSQQGPATPDHVIRTKRLPMLGRNIDAYVAAYRTYFAAHAEAALEKKTMLDPAPRVVLDSELGLLTAGRNVRDARIVADIYHHTMEVILRSDALGGYRALPSAELFDVEYWDLEQAKLRRGGNAPVFAGEVALVTGAASGIGKACVHSLLARGAAVVGLDANPTVTAMLSRPDFLGIACDVTEEAALVAALEQAARTFGGLDMLILNAGIFPSGRRIEELTGAEWDKVMRVNLDANLALLREAHPLLSRAPAGGRVVVIGSKNVPAPGPGAAAYSASKAALNQLARVAALEWGQDNIRINSVHPNAVFDTGIWTDEVLRNRAKHYGLTVKQYKTNNILRVEVSSRDVAELACEMCGPLFAKTTGAQVPIDGGNERVI